MVGEQRKEGGTIPSDHVHTYVRTCRVSYRIFGLGRGWGAICASAKRGIQGIPPPEFLGGDLDFSINFLGEKTPVSHPLV